MAGEFEIVEQPKTHPALDKLTVLEKQKVINYFYYTLNTDDLVAMLLDRASMQEVRDLARRL